MSEAKTVRPFQAEVAQVLRLVVKSLYSHKEVFLRELVSNASDALDKLRFRAISEPDLLAEGQELEVRLIPDGDAKTLTIWDNGIGMSAEELAENLGTIARSGTREFLDKLEEAKKASDAGMQLIGQFGVGFYSAFLVADRVEVTSRAAGSDEAHRWSSEAQETFTLEPAEREVHGTTVTLHLKEEDREFLEGPRLRELVRRYSDFIGYPIELETTGDSKKEPSFERINRARALWQENPKDVSAEQYEEFYKHLSHDWEPPLAHRHFKIEGTQEFAGLLFVPSRPPMHLFDPSHSHGVRLHVRRVFVMDECEELLPRWLRFIRGVVDSEDLPLNVSRELLQDSRAVRVIRKQVINHALSMIEEIAADRPDDYLKLWKAFGAVLKEGLHFDPEYKDRIAKLLRYETTAEDGWISLDTYVDRMKEGQPAIYYTTGAAKAVLASSPHLEALKKRGFEVLFMTDAVDPFAVDGLGSYRDKPLVNATSDSLELESEKPDDQKGEDEPKADPAEHKDFFEQVRSVLGDRVAEVRKSDRLTESPACLVTPKGGLAPHVRELLKAQNVDLPDEKRILEINVEHPVIHQLEALQTSGGDAERVSDWIELIYDQALLAEGSPIDDPGRFAKRLTALMTQAVARTDS